MLIGTGVRAGGGPMRYLGAPLAHQTERNTWAQAGALRNLWAGEATVIAGASIANKSGVPDGLRHPASWLMAPKPGGMSARFEAALLIDGAGLAVGGITTTGTAAMQIAAPDADILPTDDTPPARTASASFAFGATATGGLISTANGTAAMTFGASGGLLGILSGAGSATMTIDASAALGALAGGSGSASFVLNGTATALPADDTPPARTGVASFVISGTLTPYAIGHMVGTTDVSEELTADQVAAAVLAAAQATPIHADIRKVRGQALDGTGTELDPWGPA